MNPLEHLNLQWRSRVPMILQTEASECGLACLAMIASYHGHQTDLNELRRRFSQSLRGATLNDLVHVADSIGLASRPVRLELNELTQLKVPCVLHWDMNHFVVLVRADGDGAVIHDPAVGVRRIQIKALSGHFTGVALETTPTTAFIKTPTAPRLRLFNLMGRIVGLKRSLGQVMVLALAIEVLTIANPFFIQLVTDNVLVTEDRNLLLTLALAFLAILLIRIAIKAMRSWMLMALSASIRVQGRANLFSHLIRLPVNYFEGRYLGDIVSRFGSLETIQTAITTDLVEAVLDGFMVLLTLVIMYIYSPLLAFIVLVGVVLYAALRWLTYRPLRQASAEEIVWDAMQDSHLLETLRGIRSIQLLGGQNDRRSRWMNLMVETINRELTTQKLRLLFRAANSTLFGSLGIAVIAIGASRVLEHSFSLGMLIAFIAYKDQFVGRVTELINRGVDLHMLRLHADRLADIVLTEPEPREPVPTTPTRGLKPDIDVRNLRFRYGEHEPWVLDGVSFRIAPGESVAIVGPSGCGKSTLLKILASLLKPNAGEVLVGGEPLVRLGLSHYRAMTGVVLQDDQLFAGSIADNICFFDKQPELERIKRGAKMAAVHEDIVAMPMGYNTLIGDMGTVLSGGQKQRVLIARALYRKPHILLLDEATSHLDLERERAVNKVIRRLQTTRIIIAHRPETIRSADRVIVLENGRVKHDVRSLPRHGKRSEGA